MKMRRGKTQINKIRNGKGISPMKSRGSLENTSNTYT
jgi:hypothetical protein